jgi:AmiR/NasT family two-component response regulator
MTSDYDLALLALRARVVELEAENGHLRVGLSSRIVIEQAKGVLMARLDLPAEDVFELMRSAARRSRRRLHDLAAEIAISRATPGYISYEIETSLSRRDGPDGCH